MRKAAFAILVAVAGLGGAAQGADQEGAFAVKGAGALDCDAFVDARTRDAAAYERMMSWVEGYLTAINELTPGAFDVAYWRERPVLAALLDVNCRRERERRFGLVVRAMTAQLKRAPLAERSEMVEARIGERGVPIYRAALREAEEALAAQGIETGKADGEWDDATRRGLLEFQRRHSELTPTGLPDQATLAKLLGVAP